MMPRPMGVDLKAMLRAGTWFGYLQSGVDVQLQATEDAESFKKLVELAVMGYYHYHGEAPL